MLALSLPKAGQRSLLTASEDDLLKCKALLRKLGALNTPSITFESSQLNRTQTTAQASSKATGQADLKGLPQRPQRSAHCSQETPGGSGLSFGTRIEPAANGRAPLHSSFITRYKQMGDNDKWHSTVTSSFCVLIKKWLLWMPLGFHILQGRFLLYITQVLIWNNVSEVRGNIWA